MLVTGQSGSAYGYHDRWTDYGTFLYFGEGRTGDMRFQRGNRAIREHVSSGREIHLFEDVQRGQLRYLGEMTCCGYEFIKDVRDALGAKRRAIAFHLIPVDAVQRTLDLQDESQDSLLGASLADLRRVALDRPTETSAPQEARRRVWQRSRALRVYVLARARGQCESCRRDAPFKGGDGHPYLEAHHTRRISDGGPDDPRWVTALLSELPSPSALRARRGGVQ